MFKNILPTIIFFIIGGFQFSPPFVIFYYNGSFPLYYIILYFIINNILILLLFPPVLFEKSNYFMDFIINNMLNNKTQKIMFIFFFMGTIYSFLINAKIVFDLIPLVVAEEKEYQKNVISHNIQPIAIISGFITGAALSLYTNPHALNAYMYSNASFFPFGKQLIRDGVSGGVIVSYGTTAMYEYFQTGKIHHTTSFALYRFPTKNYIDASLFMEKEFERTTDLSKFVKAYYPDVYKEWEDNYKKE